jgi:hypothetical protein
MPILGDFFTNSSGHPAPKFPKVYITIFRHLQHQSQNLVDLHSKPEDLSAGPCPATHFQMRINVLSFSNED